MITVTVSQLSEKELLFRNNLLASAGLKADTAVEETVLLWDGDTLAATGARQNDILKCIAVNDNYQGEGLTATVITELRKSAFKKGYRHLFLYTKPKNQMMFSALSFHPIAKTNDILLMEDLKHGIRSFLDKQPRFVTSKNCGAIVMNCDPFTLGHRHLIETASQQCDQVYVFVLSEDKGYFSADNRLKMVNEGTNDLTNVMILPTGPYLISSATFPTYFLKENQDGNDVQCQLDIAIFSKYYIPHFGITKRFVGEEPFCPVTQRYNQELKTHLPIDVIEIPRFELNNMAVSASNVRKLLKAGNVNAASALVPKTTASFFK